jgi:hypothetical protein
MTISARPTGTRQRVNGTLMAQRLAEYPADGWMSPDGLALSCGFTLERVTGIEPALSAWEADVLPLNYTRAHEYGLGTFAS